MKKFDEIWLFVEQKLKTHIPTYFKNVLNVCGYNNGISIASIEDEDVKYIEGEVRNGNVTKYFCDVDEKKVLEDSTMSAKDFAFTLGHKKWLMTIVDFLKKYLEENGPDSFTIEDVLKKKSGKDSAKKTKKKPSQINRLVSSKGSLEMPNVSHTQTSRHDYLLEHPNENGNEIPIVDLKLQQGFLICKVIMSLINITPAMYAKHMDSINNKILSNPARIEIKKKPVNKTQKESVEEFKAASVIEAIIFCPLCTKPVTVFHKSSDTNKFLWNNSEFDWHLKNVHLNQAEINDVQEDEIFRKIAEKEPLKKVDSRESRAITSEAKAVMLEAIIPDYTEAKSLLLDKSTKTVIEKVMQPISPVETSKSMGVFIQKQTGRRENHNEKQYEKFGASSIVCYSDTSVEDEEQQQEHLYSEIVTGGNLKFEPNEKFQASQQILNSKSIAKTTYRAEVLHEADQNIDLIIPEPGKYVICSLSVNNCLQWPATTPIVKNFVGQISRMKECVANGRDVEHVEIQLLSKSPYSKCIFHYPEMPCLSQVPRKKIVKILQDPSKNRRGKYVFKDKSILDYVF